METHREGSGSDLATMKLQCLEYNYKASKFGIWGAEAEAVAAKFRKRKRNKKEISEANGRIGRTLTLDLGNGAEDSGEELDSIAERAEVRGRSSSEESCNLYTFRSHFLFFIWTILGSSHGKDQYTDFTI